MMFMDYFGFLSWILEKRGLNHQKSGQAIGVLRCGGETHVAAKAHATPRRSQMGGWSSLGFTATPQQRASPQRSSAMPRQSYCSQH